MGIKFQNNGLEVFFYIFLTLFVMASIINVVSAFQEKEKIRKWSKPFCLLFLFVMAIMAAPTHYLIYLGAFFGFLGDILFIYKDNKKCVMFGLVAFFIGHVFYIAEILTASFALTPLSSTSFVWLYIVLFGLGVAALAFYPTYLLTKRDLKFAIPGSFYAMILISVGAAALLGLANGLNNRIIVTLVGDLSFCLSDMILSFTIFQRDIKKRDFFIMVPYLIGQFLIVYGLLLVANG